MKRAYAPHHSERGAALLSVLLLVSVMSIAAIAMLDTSLGAISKARLVDARGQLSWQISGAEEAGLVGVETLRTTTEGLIHDRTPNFQETVTTPLPTGLLTTRLEDDSNCFNINALRSEPPEEGSDEVAPRSLYQSMLRALELGDAETEALTAGLVDWLDADRTQSLSGAEDTYYGRLSPPYRPANVMVTDVSEIRAVRGYSKALFNRLRPLLCARATTDLGMLNINTLSLEDAPLLSMAFSGELSIVDAARVIADRPVGGWLSVAAMMADERIEAIAPDLRRLELLSTRSRFLRLNGRVSGETETADFTVIYILPESAPARIVRRTYGAS